MQISQISISTSAYFLFDTPLFTYNNRHLQYTNRYKPLLLLFVHQVTNKPRFWFELFHPHLSSIVLFRKNPAFHLLSSFQSSVGCMLKYQYRDQNHCHENRTFYYNYLKGHLRIEKFERCPLVMYRFTSEFLLTHLLITWFVDTRNKNLLYAYRFSVNGSVIFSR